MSSHINHVQSHQSHHHTPARFGFSLSLSLSRDWTNKKQERTDEHAYVRINLRTAARQHSSSRDTPRQRKRASERVREREERGVRDTRERKLHPQTSAEPSSIRLLRSLPSRPVDAKAPPGQPGQRLCPSIPSTSTYTWGV